MHLKGFIDDYDPLNSNACALYANLAWATMVRIADKNNELYLECYPDSVKIDIPNPPDPCCP